MLDEGSDQRSHRSPIVAGNAGLCAAELCLCKNCCKHFIVLNCLVSSCCLVGGTEATGFKSLNLILLVGKPLCELVCFAYVFAVAVNTDELATHIGGKLLFFSTDLNGGKLCNAHVFAKLALNSLCVPNTGNACCYFNLTLCIGSKACDQLTVVGLDNECGMVYVLNKRLHNCEAVCIVIVDVNLLLGESCIIGYVVCEIVECEEEAGEIPTVIVEPEVNLSAGSVCSIEKTAKGSYIFSIDNRLIVVQEQGVVLGAGICIEHILTVDGNRCRLNRGCSVVISDILFSLTANACKSAACDELVDLVACKREYVGAGGYVVENLVGCVAFALNTKQELVFLIGVCSCECCAHLFEHFLVFLRTPNSKGYFFFLSPVVAIIIVTSSKHHCKHQQSDHEGKNSDLFHRFLLVLYFCGYQNAERAKPRPAKVTDVLLIAC